MANLHAMTPKQVLKLPLVVEVAAAACTDSVEVEALPLILDPLAVAHIRFKTEPRLMGWGQQGRLLDSSWVGCRTRFHLESQTTRSLGATFASSRFGSSSASVNAR
eukprot:790868-Amphidinium_carterae.1